MLRGIWKRICLDFRSNESPDAGAGAEQEPAVIAFSQTSDSHARPRRRIEFRRARFPSPHSVPHSHPEIALAVLIHAANSVNKTSVFSIALDAAAAAMNRAQLGRRRKPVPADPYRALTVLEHGSANELSGKLRVLD